MALRIVKHRESILDITCLFLTKTKMFDTDLNTNAQKAVFETKTHQISVLEIVVIGVPILNLL